MFATHVEIIRKINLLTHLCTADRHLRLFYLLVYKHGDRKR